MAIEIDFPGGKKVSALIDGFTIMTDQAVEDGGEVTAAAPFSLFLASLGTCAGVYVKGFCDQRGISSEGMRISMDYEYDPVQRMIVKFIMQIHVTMEFPVEYESAVIRSASLCAVKRHLHPSIANDITIVRY
jgi:ribosomal protein S12 methylthiotransferase accessory factor